MLFARLEPIWVLGVSAQANRRAMLITFVQSVISPLDKDFPPLDQRGRKKCSNRAENHLLEKSRLHVDFSSTLSAIAARPFCPDFNPAPSLAPALFSANGADSWEPGAAPQEKGGSRQNSAESATQRFACRN